MAPIDRRELILIGVGAGAAAALLALMGDRRGARIADEQGPRKPGLTGELTTPYIESLWLLFGRIAAHYEMAGLIDLDKAQFTAILNAKTGFGPSYLVEYQAAVQLLKELEPRLREDPSTVESLVRESGLDGFLESESVERLRRFVIDEFLEWQMAFGGFRVLGYRNYRGFAGGPLSDTSRLPYRTL